MEEEAEKSFTERIYEKAEQYVKTTIELYKLKTVHTVSDVVSAMATGFVIWVIVFLFLLFLSIGTAFYLGEILGGLHYGFFIVAGIYILLGLIIYIGRVKCLKIRINNFIIKQIFKD
ncbi:MAG: hypothetical protein EOO48_04475 [Flavobacterium sp.]|nr:MAG: hypothetical protein EOO48_04475 [Flavobacterium sp.]